MSDAPLLSPGEQVETRLKELKVTLDPTIPYRLEKLFPKIKGWGSNGEMKRRGKLIRLVEPTLKQMLFPNEEVQYVAKGVQYSLAETYFMGALWAALLNQTVFVLTNVRLLMMRSKSSGKPSEMFWMIYYSEIKEFKPTWSGAMNLKLNDKKKLLFTGFPALDRKSMPAIFQAALDDYRKHDFEPTTSQSKENLCSHCYQIVPKGDYTCEQCGTSYWTPMQLALRSLVFPSWGDICMKHYGMALFELLGYLISWGVAAAHFVGPAPFDGLYMVGFIFLLEHPFDAVLTHIVASKGLCHRSDPPTNHEDEETLDDSVDT